MDILRIVVGSGAFWVVFTVALLAAMFYGARNDE